MKQKLLIFLLFIISEVLTAQTPTFQWAKSAGRYTSHDYCESISTDMHGNSYITGQFQDTIDFGPTTLVNTGTYGENIFIAKYDASGNIVWAKIPGGNHGSEGFGIAADRSGNVYVTGSFRGSISFGATTLTANGTGNFFIAKYDSSGTPLWAQKAICGAAQSGKSICVDKDGGVYATGTFEDSTISFGNFSISAVSPILGTDVFLVKYDASGNVLWATGGGGGSTDISNAVNADNKGNSYITGVYRNSITFGTTTLTAANSGGASVFTVKYNSVGSLVWAKSSGGFPCSGYGTDISNDAFGNSYVAGYFNSPIIYFDGDTLINAGINDIFLLKYDSLGNVVWARSAGGNNFDQAEDVYTDETGNSYLTGFIKLSAHFGPITMNAVNQDVFVVKYDSAGTPLWGVKSTGNLNETTGGISSDNAQNIYIGGRYSSPTAIFGTIPLVNSDAFLGSYDLFIAKLNYVATGIPENAILPANFFLYPNPVSDRSILSFYNEKNESFDFKIFDVTGKCLESVSGIISNEVEIDKNTLPAGLYVFRLSSEKGTVISGKFIVE
ncbi:MAG: SBBP repeat-containing protein [Bacteroidetes bacterium]|nr:SBBP repeat-containing protein [Bacteroidota bacterium]MBP6426207.1 SBBP repeat-containing protein [Bacteroidia bacterium]MBK8365036.1 SBBP repeat-containing protein [Bacteroidota bacterium]MBK9414397.1 SBBP repeat-containing protein [Bacteroidota bacterium]MBL0030954.1 SBBP repeat-containing protein [Bacteroidota bacterium]